MTWYRRVLALGLVATLALVGAPIEPAAGADPAPATTIECGQEITTDVVLSHDLTCPYDGDSVFRVDEGVTVDLGGHTVTVDEPRGQHGYIATSGGRLINGRLVDLSMQGRELELSRVRIERTDLAVASMTIDHSVLIDSHISLSIEYPYGADDGEVTIDHNWIRSTPIVLDDVVTALRARIESNIIERSPSHGIEILTACCYEPGDVEGGITGNWILNNTLDGINVPGMFGDDYIGGFGDFTIADNLLVANGGDGINIAGQLAYFRDLCPDDTHTCPPAEQYLWGGAVVLRNNLAALNGGHGIHVDTPSLRLEGYGDFLPPPGLGVVDGGGNRALFNSQRPACVGVTCRWW